MFKQKIIDLLAPYWPARSSVDLRERARIIMGAGLGILATALLVRWMGGIGHPAVPWLAAPLGASAVLVFAVPTSPLAQPWAVIGGNVLSALVGSVCALLIGDPAWAGALAVALAIALMFCMRCLHPPGGATALLTAMSAADWRFAFFPMLVDAALLVAAGVIYNSITGRRYPPPPAKALPLSAPAGRFSEVDLDAALARYNQVLDVSRDDLGNLLRFAEAAAYERNFGQLVCRDIMSRDPMTAQFGDMLDEAWKRMRLKRIKALPVTDRSRRVVGIVTVADFLTHAGFEQTEGIAERLRALIRREGAVYSSKPDTVGEIMTREVRVASDDRPVADLVPLFSEDGHHHIPIIDHERRLVGIITQSDLVRAIYRATSNPAK